MTQRVRKKDYKEILLSTGVRVRVHRVPEAIVSSVLPARPRPRRPQIEMETLGGRGTQKRAIKEGDEGWEDYVREKDEWTKEKDQLQDDVTLVLSLKSQEIPEDVESSLPEEVRELISDGLLQLPETSWGLKAFYLRCTLLVAYQDELEVNWTRQELTGVPEEVIEEMKAKFRDTLYGELAGAMGAATEETDAGQSEEEDEDQSVG